MENNLTSDFLGNRYSWPNTKIELDDVQALYGGIHVYLPGETAFQAYVTRVAPGGSKTKYKLPLGRQEKDALCQLFIEQDFLSIEPEERPGIPDEARPAITLGNYTGKTHTVSKWQGIKNERFDAIYRALKQIGERSKDF
ncbi:MAG: hypothetical protein H6667_03600 [Ardenticatenaceae bacterium]|nr:hypothetical protein [Ardenticatenaceae bacterium]MCB9443093.1 hypothetical protein [Ardenticatenaceae bacterium]